MKNIKLIGNTFGERIKSARLAKGLSQRQLSKLAGLSQPTINQLEAGKIKGTTKVLPLSRSLDVEPVWLLYGGSAGIDRDVIAGKPKNTEISQDNGQSLTKTVPFLPYDAIIDYITLAILPSNYKTRMIAMNVHDAVQKHMAFTVETDAMESKDNHRDSIYRGEEVIVNCSRQPASGDVVCLITKDSVRIRVYQTDGNQIYLKALNSDYAPMEMNDEIIIGGVITDVSRRLVK
jgi:SOS-response transcriptional repressor LexA